MERSEVWAPSGTTPVMLDAVYWKVVAASWQHGRFSAAHLIHRLHLLLISTSNFLQNYDCTYTAMDFVGYWISPYCNWTGLHLHPLASFFLTTRNTTFNYRSTMTTDLFVLCDWLTRLGLKILLPLSFLCISLYWWYKPSQQHLRSFIY